jgi:Domain of unknown function (DUF1844)
MNTSDQEPKIIVDDDWKSQVEKEKEQLRKKMDDEPRSKDDLQLPPASIPVLVTTLATQALANLGQIPDPVENQPVVRKPLAKHFIDTLSVLEEKTAGNLSEDESAILTESLHQLRMIYVKTPDQKEVPGKPRSSTIELPR